MKKSIKISSKRIFAGNAIASVRIEGMRVSTTLEKDLDAYTQGKKTISEIIQSTKLKYVTL
ncbi:VbhA_like domain containing protein [Methylophilaceae bacterium]|jgi:hypothetical protein